MKTPKIIYEKEDDVLNIWLSNKPIDYGDDPNNEGVITHYTKEGEPVYIEVLDASRFLKVTDKKAKKNYRHSDISIAVPHQIRK